MSYFLDSIRHDKYIIDEKYFKNYKGVVYLPLIEIYDGETIDFDFTNVDIECSDNNIKDVKINKIYIDYGDDEKEVITEKITSGRSTIGDSSLKNWNEFSHTFSSKKKHVYKDIKEVSSYPHVTIIFYNQYNDKFYYIIPYKILYKSFYESSGELSLMDANINNNNITSFTLREKKSNSIVVVLSSSGFSEETSIFSDPLLMTDTSDDYYVDDEDMIWNWSIYPELEITKSESDINDEYRYDVTLDWKEKKVSLYKFEMLRQKMGTNESPKLISSDFKVRPYKDKNLLPGIYKYTFNIVGINDLSNSNEVIIKCQPYYPATILIPSNKEIVKKIISEPQFEISFSLKNTSDTPTSFDMFRKFDIILKNEDNLLEYRYDVLKSNVDDRNEVHSLIIDSDVIPDGRYTVILDVQDVCGGSTNGFLSISDGLISQPSFTMSYGIGYFDNFVINNNPVNDFSSPNEIKIENEKSINFEWSFIKNGTSIGENNASPGNVDFFDLVLESIK